MLVCTMYFCQIYSKKKSHKEVSENEDFCNVVITSEHTKII